MPIRIVITDNVYQIYRLNNDGTVTESFTLENPLGLPAQATTGDIMIKSPTGWTRLPIGTNGQVLTVDTGLAGKIEWADPTGGSGLPSPSTKGDVLISNGTTWVQVPVGTNGQVLTANSADSEGVAWTDPASGLTLTGVTAAVTETVTGGEAIAANLLVKLSSDGKFYIWQYTDDPYLVYGVSATACAGNNQTFLVAFGSVKLPVKSDGTTTIAPGDRVEPSTTVNGRVKKGETNPIGISVSTVAATLDALCQVRL